MKRHLPIAFAAFGLALLAPASPLRAEAPDLLVELPLLYRGPSLDKLDEGAGHLALLAEGWSATKLVSFKEGLIVDGLPCKVVVLQGRPWVRAVSLSMGDDARPGSIKGQQGGVVYSAEGLRALREALVAHLGSGLNVRLRAQVTWTGGNRSRGAMAPVVELGPCAKAVDILDRWIKEGALLSWRSPDGGTGEPVLSSLGGNLPVEAAPAPEAEEKKEAAPPRHP